MKLTHTRILVDRYQQCYRFYKDILNLECTWGDEDSNYAQFQAGNTLIAIFDKRQMLDDLDEKSPAFGTPANDVMLIFAVEDVDRTYQELQEKIEFITAPHDRKDWGIRVAHFRAPNGTLIEINKNI